MFTLLHHVIILFFDYTVSSNLIVKLADFGMARGVQENDYYRIAGQAVLPVRWLAPESLVYGVFTSASDVWYVHLYMHTMQCTILAL